MKCSKVFLLGMDARERSLAGITVRTMRECGHDAEAETVRDILAACDAGQHLTGSQVETLRKALDEYGPKDSMRSGTYTDQGIEHTYTYSIVDFMCSNMWSLVR